MKHGGLGLRSFHLCRSKRGLTALRGQLMNNHSCFSIRCKGVKERTRYKMKSTWIYRYRYVYIIWIMMEVWKGYHLGKRKPNNLLYDANAFVWWANDNFARKKEREDGRRLGLGIVMRRIRIRRKKRITYESVQQSNFISYPFLICFRFLSLIDILPFYYFFLFLAIAVVVIIIFLFLSLLPFFLLFYGCTIRLRRENELIRFLNLIKMTDSVVYEYQFIGPIISITREMERY